jgi:hypothetical protein
MTRKILAAAISGIFVLLSPGAGCYQAVAGEIQEVKTVSSEMPLGGGNEAAFTGSSDGRSQAEGFLDGAAYQTDGSANSADLDEETLGIQQSAGAVTETSAGAAQGAVWINRVKQNVANLPNNVRTAHGNAVAWVHNAVDTYRRGLPLVLNFDGLSPHGHQLAFAAAGDARTTSSQPSLKPGNSGWSFAKADKTGSSGKPSAAKLSASRRSIDLSDKIDSLLGITQTLQNFNGDFERRNAAQLRRRMYLLSFSMSLNEPYKVIDMYLLMFRQMEKSYLIIRGGDEKVAQLGAEVKAGRLSAKAAGEQMAKVTADPKRQKALDYFGINYHEYFLVRSYLEQARDHNRLAHTYDVGGHDPTAAQPGISSAVKDSAKPAFNSPASVATLILNRLDLPDGAGYLQDSGLPQFKGSAEKDAFALANFRQLFGIHPEIRYAGIKSDLAQEIWATTKYFALAEPVLDLVKNLIYRLPASVRTPVSAVMGIAYDEHVRDKFLPDIERVSRSPVTGDASLPFPRLTLLRDLNAKNGQNNLMLVTFARLVEYRGVWTDLKLQIKAGQAAQDDNMIKKDSSYAKFLSDMDAAETQANKLGPISLLYDQRPIDKASKFIYAAAVLAFYFHTHPAVVHQMTSSLQGIFHSLGL